MLAAVTEIVFQMVAFGLEHIVILVFDLPASAPIPHNGFDIRLFYPEIRTEGILIELFARVFACDGQFTPVHLDRLWVSS